MNIGVMGYYGFGNVGDEVILDVLRQYLAPHSVIAIPLGLPPSEITFQRLNNFDFFILGGGGLYNSPIPPSPFFCFDRWMDRLATPLGVLGLGVDVLPPEYVPVTRQLVEATQFFVVRDEQSKQLIDHPKIQVAPDLTFFHPIRVYPNSKGHTDIVCGVNIRGGKGDQLDLSWARSIARLPVAKRAIPFALHPELNDREILLEVDPHCPDRFSPCIYSGIDILVGFAFHSLIFAIQNGVPAVAINYKPKVRRLMEEVGLGEYVLELEEWDKLPECFARAIDNRTNIRQRMLDYTADAEKKLCQAILPLREIINGSRSRVSRTAGRPAETPKISIIIDCREANPKEAARTINSAINQTYPNTEIIVDCGEFPNNDIDFELQGVQNGRIQWITGPRSSQDWVAVGLEKASGDFVILLSSNTWLIEDAAVTFFQAYQSRCNTVFAYAEAFITNGEVIERIIKGEEQFQNEQRNLCIFLSTEKARQILSALDGCPGEFRQAVGRSVRKALNIPHPLSFRQANVWELSLYRSALAYSRGLHKEASKWLSCVLANKDSLTEAEKRDITDLYSDIILQSIKSPLAKPVIQKIASELDRSPVEIRSLRRKIISCLAIHWFFEAYYRKNCLGMFRSLWVGFRNDPIAWLRNRGIWKCIIQCV